MESGIYKEVIPLSNTPLWALLTQIFKKCDESKDLNKQSEKNVSHYKNVSIKNLHRKKRIFTNHSRSGSYEKKRLIELIINFSKYAPL